MHNLKSLTFNHETGKSFIDKRSVKIATPPLVTIYEDVSDTKIDDFWRLIQEDNLQKIREARKRAESEIRTYKFKLYKCISWFGFAFDDRIRVWTDDGDTDYMINYRMKPYFEQDGRMSYDYMLEFLAERTCCDFEVKASLNFLNTESGRQTVVSKLIDSIYELITADIALDDYKQWLQNEYYYV